MKISFNQVAFSAQKNKKKILSSISSVIDSEIFLHGRENKKLKKNFLHYLGKDRYLTVCASGHDALSLSLSALKLTKEDEIIFPVNAYPTAFPVCLSSGTAVGVDVDKNGQIDPEGVQKKINRRTRVVILVHLYGLVGKIEKIQEVIRGRKIVLIEDCAQALGSKYKGQMVGTFGDIGCFSFYPTKNISTLGDGGAIWTKHRDVSAFLEKAVSYGEKIKYQSEFLSGHSRLAEIQAGIINSLFATTKTNFKKRNEVAHYYRRRIQEETLLPFVRILESDPKSKPVEHLFVIRVKRRDQLKKYLGKYGIETHIHYPKPIHLVSAFSYLGYKKGDFPVAERLSESILSLPFHPFLSNQEINYIIKTIKEFYG